MWYFASFIVKKNKLSWIASNRILAWPSLLFSQRIVGSVFHGQQKLSLYLKQYGLKSDCSLGSSLIRVVLFASMKRSGPKVIKLEYSLKLKIKRNDWLLADTSSHSINCALFWSGVCLSACRRYIGWTTFLDENSGGSRVDR